MYRDVDHVISKIRQWHHDRDLISGSTDNVQFEKLLEEVGELKGFVGGDQSDLEDHIGDIIVVLINLCERNRTTLEVCLNVAYTAIKDRNGKLVNGIFVKD